jgi:hypothetical protein
MQEYWWLIHLTKRGIINDHGAISWQCQLEKKEIMNSNRGLLQHSYHTEIAGELIKHALQRAFKKCVTASICRCSKL